MRAKPSRNFDEAIFARWRIAVHAGVAHVKQRFPALRSTRLVASFWMRAQPRLDPSLVSEYERRL
jgi:hypothetical protein